MALVPSRQLYPTTTTFLDSFQSSHVATRLQFLRYGSSSSIPSSKKHTFNTTHYTLNSDSTPHQNPQKINPNSVVRTKNNRWVLPNETPNSQSNSKDVSGASTSSSWLDKWSETGKKGVPRQPRAALNYRNVSNSGSGSPNSGSGSSTMDRIVEKLKKFGYVDDVNEKKEENGVIEKGSIEDIFYVEEGMLPNPRGGFSRDSPLGVENGFGIGGKVRFPWEKPGVEGGEKSGYSVRQKSRTCVAEMTLPESELRRLKNLAMRTKKKTRIGGGGVTQAVVDLIHEKWKSSEIVRLKIEGAPALNMRRMHEILERKTGGLVVWRSGSSVCLYRGVSYEDPAARQNKRQSSRNETFHNSFPITTETTSNDSLELTLRDEVHEPGADSAITAEEKRVINSMPETKVIKSSPEMEYEDEIDKLLDGLGPRYTDWPGNDPLPVDADLLPGIVPGFQPPFRILPYGVRSTLAVNEATALRRLARVIPPHFALGRSRQHQGLAMAMIKLWERSSIAKIALKRGVQLTTSERMAEDIKKLTGSVLLSRNKDFLVFYRGKNFLSPEVAEALLEKETLAKSLQDEEEVARLRASTWVLPSVELTDASGTAGTLGETMDANAKWGKRLDDRDRKKVLWEAEVQRHANLVRKLESKLGFAERKLMRAERALSKVEGFLNPKEGQPDPESITDEERFMFRKLGLRMKAFLLLGRRGVFDGTVENMHLHWKYRELVKVMVKAKTFDEVKKVALSLEAESGGVLVSVDKVSKGYAIIVFRGKDYKRPSSGLRPKNLLTKRKALARSIELQRHEALLNHISTLESRVGKLRSELGQMATVKDTGDEELYEKLDSAYPSEDEDSEEEEYEEEYLETYDTDNNGKDETDNSVDNSHLETNFPYDLEESESESETEDHNPHEVESGQEEIATRVLQEQNNRS